MGVGIADSDADANSNPVNIFLQALNSTGGDLGAAEEINITEVGSNPGNGYFYVTDTTDDVYGIQITQSVSNPSLYSRAGDRRCADLTRAIHLIAPHRRRVGHDRLFQAA